MNILSIYLFVSAAFLSVIPIVFLVRYYRRKLEEHPQQLVDVQKKFFIFVGLSKIIPVILIIIGMAMQEKVIDPSDLYLPWLLIGILVAYGLYDLSNQKKQYDDQQVQVAIHTLVTIARPLIFSIPIMSAIFLYMMTL